MDARRDVAALRAWADEHGRAPHHDQWQAGGREHPPASTVANLFGSWSAALRTADLTPALHRTWGEAEILDGRRAFAHAHGRPPTSGDLRNTRGTPYPPATAVIRTCGSLRAALAQLGWQAASTRVADTEIRDALHSESTRASMAGHPVHGVAREHRNLGASVIIRRHGSWSAALAAALAPDSPNSS